MTGRNLVLRTITLTASYVPLSDAVLVADFVVTALDTNAGPCFFAGEDGSDVKVAVNNWFEFRGVDLAQLRMKGTAGDKVTIIGNA